MMRIGYLSMLAAPDEAAVSGVPKVSETLLREFERRPDVTVEAITLIDDLPAPVVRQRGAVRYHYLPCRRTGKTATLYVREVRKLRRRVRQLGVSLVHGQPTSEYLLAATGSGLPHVVTIHGLVFREASGLPWSHPAYLASVIREKLQRRAAARAANLISISPYVEEYLQGWAPGRRWPVPNPIEDDFFGVAPPERDGLRVLCVGVVSERKNQMLLLQACAELKRRGIRFECQLVGALLPGMAERISAFLQQEYLSSAVTVRGKIPAEALLAAYAWSNVVVLPSREETSPLSLIQAMACGRCVMGARAAGIPSLLEQERYGTLFSPEDPASLTEVLAQWAVRPEVFWAKAWEARSHAANCFKPASVAARTIEVYREILASPQK